MRELEKEELEFLKLHVSALFARRMKYLWIDVRKPTIWYFSTLGAEMNIAPSPKKEYVSLFVYRTNSSDFISKLVFKTASVTELLFDTLPDIPSGYVCIDVPTYMAVLNKNELINARLADDGVMYWLKHVKNKEPQHVKLLYMIDNILMNHFIVQYENIESLITTQYTMQIVKPIHDISQMNKADLSFIDIESVHPTDKTLACNFRYPIYEGKSTVSVSEYLKKLKSPYSLRFVASFRHTSVVAMMEFENSVVLVRSLQPVASWFPIFSHVT